VPGTNGTPGSTGAAGKDGRDGRDGRVTCRVTRAGKSVACTVAYSKFATATSARLVRRGRTVARGRLVRGKVTFSLARKLAKGTYTIVAGGRNTRIVIR